MASPSLPDYATAYESLCARGDQFPADSRRIATADYQHPTRGRQRVAFDSIALSGTKQVYVDEPLRAVFKPRDITLRAASDAVATVSGAFSAQSLVWGFSGFATAGYPYEIEAEGMSALLECLEDMEQRPALITDGGVGVGVLGLSGVLARRHGIPSMGFLPTEGLASFGPRDHLVVKGETYRDREKLVGTAPDVLVCVGGAEGTRRECEAALASGGIVVLLALRRYGLESLWASHRDSVGVRSAAEAGQLFRCEHLSDIAAVADRAVGAARLRSPGRFRRMAMLAQLLKQ